MLLGLLPVSAEFLSELSSRCEIFAMLSPLTQLSVFSSGFAMSHLKSTVSFLPWLEIGMAAVSTYCVIYRKDIFLLYVFFLTMQCFISIVTKHKL